MNKRSLWGSSFGFILAAAGSAIGVGNLWKFPYIAWENNGGAFVLIYVVCVALVGLPIMIAELLIGKRAQLSTVPAIEKLSYGIIGGKKWKWMGWLGILGSAIILSYVSVIAGWSIAYFYICLKWSLAGYIAPKPDVFNTFLANTSLQFILALLFSIVTAFIVYKGISRGIEKANKILMPALFAILILLLVNSFTMDGFKDAFTFIFQPNFKNLHFLTVLEALGQSFFSLSLAMGIMITYGSYMKKTSLIPTAAVVVVSMDTLVAIIACLIMYPIIFTYPELKSNISGNTVGMLFTTLPTLFYTKMTGGLLVGPIFYLLVTFAALSSTISLLEVVVSLMIDKFSFPRKKGTLTSTALVFILTSLVIFSLNPEFSISRFQLFGTSETGLFYQLNQLFFRGKIGFMNVADHFVANWLLPITGLLITLFAGWFLPRKVSMEELNLINEKGQPTIYFKGFRFLIRFIAPISILYIIYNVFKGADFS